jgi:hypothetical protein
MSKVALQILLDDLVWWAKPLAEARKAGELAPGVMRMIAARAAQESK